MKKQILIVEDNELNRAILCEILSGEYQVLEAENGQDALDILHQYAGSISLILLDVMMPVMDGYTFLDRINDDEKLSLIPVIVMTQSGSEEDEIAALSHGATDFVPKPYSPQVLMHRAASIIKLRETAAIVNQFKYDKLTGLYSKEFFYQKVQERLLENPEEDYCIVCSNIENFKLVNDIFGAKAGDRLLKEVAEITQNMVGDTGFCGRFSGDRFICLQSRKQEQEDRHNFGMFGNYELSPLLKSVVMRWGIYQITDRSIPVEQMCDRALLAVNSIKGQYNQFFAVYDDSLRDKLLREQAVTDAMQKAVDEEQFEVYYQPKYSLNSNSMTGVEALVRWIHPEWGVMSPGEFIPLFEKNGFITRLDQYVWVRVCEQLQEWRDKGCHLLPVSVNISRTDVYQLDLADTLQRLLEKYQIAPAYLHLEITESAYAENPAKIVNTVDELRKLGFVVEMDNFGSGYSSLNMLSHMKVDVLKLDMQMVRNETSKPAGQSILKDVISMAHRMLLSVVAEGVESREQVERLQAVGCDYVQGYYFAEPMTAPEYEELLKKCQPQTENTEPVIFKGGAEQYSLLIVDEDSDYREKVRKTFEKKYSIMETDDVETALSCIRACEGIVVVALSMTLPENGADSLMKVLRQEPAFWNVPVLASIPGGDRAGEFPMAIETDDFICKCHPVFDMSRRVQRLMEKAASSRRESILKDEANRDFLTGLLNRRGLQAAMSSMRREDEPLAVYMFDLDNLKLVNDTDGHSEGDRMIQTFADLLRRNTRNGDIICRYGGDEFLAVLKRMKQEETALRKGEEICTEFRECFEYSGGHASCTGGVAMCGTYEMLSAELIDRADQALYRAKQDNKGSCFAWKL